MSTEAGKRSAHTHRKMLVGWLYAMAAVHLVAGLALPWLGGWALLDDYHKAIEVSFWGAAAPAAARAQQEWWLGLFGPTVQSVSLWMAALIYFGDRYRNPVAWVSLLAGLLLWGPQDMAFSLRAGAWSHVWLDLLALATMAPPLFVLLRMDRNVRGPEAAVKYRSEGEPRLRFSDVPQTCLVTGATGFIGQKLVRSLCADGHDVIVLSRDPRRAAWQFGGAVRCIERLDALPPTVRVDVVFNLAGARILGLPWTERRKASLRRSRITLTEGLVDWIARLPHKPRLLVSASAIGFYGIQAPGDDTLLDEASPPQPIFMSQLCAEWEAAARRAEDHGVHVVCTRLGLVLGNQGALPMMALPIRLGLGGPLGSGEQWLSWVHVDDLLGAFAFIMAAAAPSPTYNLTAPGALHQGQFSATAARVLRRPSFFPTPAWPMRWLLGEQASLLLDGQRVSPANLQSQGYRFVFPQLTQALTAIFRP